jgi:hypothetical protein
MVALAGALTAMPAVVAGSNPTSESVLRESLLQAGDLPWSASSDGVNVVATDDIPPFAANGGLLELSQVWSSMEPYSTVFDFRFQFPDAASALAFLDAAEQQLSEVGIGAKPQDPISSPVPDTRFYYYEGLDVGYNFLMRHENLVAKVYVSTLRDQIDASDASLIAGSAANRMVNAIGGTPAVDELLSHVPSAIRGTCAPSRPVFTESGELAELECPQSEALSVSFSLFDTADSMDRRYDVAHDLASVMYDTSAQDCSAGSYDGIWRLGDEEAGRLMCYDSGISVIIWSHPDTRIYAVINDTGRDAGAAYDLWLAAGPE